MAFLNGKREPLLPGQKSAVMCGLPYPAAELSPHIAPYGLLKDYHLVLREKLLDLESFILGAFPGCSTRIFVDTLPVLERALAHKAGIGAIGKNTMLINKTHGSYLFLGGIMTDLELVPDSGPSENPCGNCSKCITSCPTGALSDYHLDSRKCLSYHTIENKGDMPAKIGKAMGERVFGCGICEKVCPLNNSVSYDGFKWESNKPAAEAGLESLLAMAQASFRKNFDQTPVMRAGKKGFIRNCMIALGNRA